MHSMISFLAMEDFAYFYLTNGKLLPLRKVANCFSVVVAWGVWLSVVFPCIHSDLFAYDLFEKTNSFVVPFMHGACGVAQSFQ